MKVLTLNPQALKTHSLKLLQAVQDDSFKADILIGIATGGVYISRPIHESLKAQAWQGSYHEITLQRASTKTKKALYLKKVFKYLPYSILNILRILENNLSEKLKNKTYQGHREKEVVLNEVLKEEISKAKTLLLIDDAIDSGTTLVSVKNVIQNLNPMLDIRTAVLTVTHKKPYIEADYTLYRNTLLRCPWAEDYKGNKNA